MSVKASVNCYGCDERITVDVADVEQAADLLEEQIVGMGWYSIMGKRRQDDPRQTIRYCSECYAMRAKVVELRELLEYFEDKGMAGNWHLAVPDTMATFHHNVLGHDLQLPDTVPHLGPKYRKG